MLLVLPATRLPLQPFASQNAAIQKAIELWRQLKAYL
jgi:hypothetical protein